MTAEQVFPSSVLALLVDTPYLIIVDASLHQAIYFIPTSKSISLQVE